MTTIFLIRHAEAEGNLYRIAQGQHESILTPWGQLQVEALQRRFQSVHIDAVYASDLYRTRATAAAICVPKGLPLHRCPELREIYVGAWEQKTWGDIALEMPEQMENFSWHPDRWEVPGAESVAALQDRIRRSIQEIADANDGRTIAIVSHGYAIRVFLAWLEGYSLAELGQTPVGTNTAVSLLESENGKLRLIYRDDSSHLDSLPRGPRRNSALEPGLYYRPATAEDTAFLDSCRADLGAFAAELLAHTERPLTVAWQQGKPVGLLQLDPDRDAGDGIGWITLYWMAPPFRNHSLGIQLLGQAVQFYRERNRTLLHVETDRPVARRFFQRYGFTEHGAALELDIGFREPDWKT